MPKKLKPKFKIGDWFEYDASKEESPLYILGKIVEVHNEKTIIFYIYDRAIETPLDTFLADVELDNQFESNTKVENESTNLGKNKLLDILYG
jgi:hypothetical protein